MPVSLEALSRSLEVLSENPIIIVPSLVPAILDLLLKLAIMGTRFHAFMHPLLMMQYYGLMMIGGFVTALVGFIAVTMEADMANDVFQGAKADLEKSLDRVLKTMGTLIGLAIISAIFAMTIILVPVALFLITIAIVDEVGVGEAISRSFSFVTGNLGEVLLFVIAIVIIDIILSLIPFIGGLLTWLANCVFIMTSVLIYRRLSGKGP